jgi:threonylcarbamoyladenosine tRNA methylthiotransferase MtaB
VPSAAFTTLGCKVNQYETQRILESFAEDGFEVVPFDQPADVYVINTCSVTSIAESKSRYTVRRALRNNPVAKVVVTGCAAQMSINQGEKLPGADVVVPNPDKLRTLEFVRKALPELFPQRSGASPPPGPSSKQAIRGEGEVRGRTRATLKIQDGCSVMCSYCSIPFTRPGMVSRPAEEVVAEAVRMAEMGYREIVLTGVLIGAYGPDSGSGGPDFEGLIDQLRDALRPFEPFRLRISSIEMRQVTPDLIARLREGDMLVPHLHIPLQAGSDRVLADMNRPYRQADYLRLCDELYRSVPNLNITTDIMVGFPTETEDDFAETVRVCEEVGYLKIHAFRFSPRHGTPADAMGDPISPLEKQRRSLALNEISIRTGRVRARQAMGKVLRVLVEGKPRPDGLLEGLSDEYLTVQFAGPPTLVRSFAHVRIEDERDGVLYGELASPESAARLRMAI